MADTIPPDDIFELKSALQMLVAEMRDAANGTNGFTRAVGQQLASEEEKLKQSRAATAETNKAKESFKNIAAAGKNVANEFLSIADAGAKLSATLGVSLTRGTQLELNNRMSLLGQLRNIEVDRMATMQQIQAAEKSFVDVLGGARKGMEISAAGATQFASRLKAAAGGEFTMTATAMRAMITAGIGGAQGLEKFKNATGLRSISEQRFATLVSKNSLSFMLYGPRFAKAANEAEKLGISLASVQGAQESMVTNLDGTLDTLNQVNQLGAQIDFGTLTQLNETQGPEATLKYLQSTIPPSLFQSASTRALLKGFNISVEDLMKGQQSAQKSAADKIEEQLSKMEEPVGTIAKTMALLNSIIEKVKNSFGPLIIAIGTLGLALIGLKGANFGALTKMFPALSSIGKFFTGLSTKALAGVGAGIFGGIAGFTAAKASGRDNFEAAGDGLVRGGFAAGGAILGTMFGPIGTIIGGFLGDLIGKALNKYFPGLANNIGQYLKGFLAAFKPLKETFSQLMSSFRELGSALFGGEQGLSAILPYMKDFGYIVGTVILAPIQLVIKALSSVINMITVFAKVLSGDFSGAFKTFRGGIANFLPGWAPDALVNKIRGDDVVSRSGYGDRTLTTPNGSVALNNRDTVVAFADDMISGVRTLSLGSIARQSRGASSDTTLVNKINELITVLQNSNTTINIDNSSQTVPRQALAGVYVRNQRV